MQIHLRTILYATVSIDSKIESAMFVQQIQLELEWLSVEWTGVKSLLTLVATATLRTPREPVYESTYCFRDGNLAYL